ncbi:Porin [Nitrospira tepida]|uniref:Porin n=1 Tax=Nitrospira tepida TaxID=2973512 RepID=A0AA86N3L5_9BACT|nr:outer membrane beta-barrel protein [Nitrospira tepida]CAI4034079.1 Porin [Nitrospira tepida]
MIGPSGSCSVIVTLLLLGLFGTMARAGDTPDLNCASPASVRHETDDKSRLWRYGACVDLSYALDFNFPQNHLWRSKGTTPRVNEFAPNLGLIYVRKDMTTSSPWGMEFGLQGGYDTQGLVPPTRPEIDRPIGGADTLRHLSRANVSYLAPVGTGLTITAGLFNSFIGYESFYAMNNHTSTRTYIADYSPYFMLGISAQYRISDRIKAAIYVVNGYNYLSKPNDQPSYGAQVVWSASARMTVTQNLYAGPDQFKTSTEFWRVFSDSIIEYKFETVTLALAYDIGTEQIAQAVGAPRTFWTGGMAVARWQFSPQWAVALRPEFYWDRTGQLTGTEQLIKAVTSTLEYKLPYRRCTKTIVRLEYRYDESTGSGGGFFKDGEIRPGVVGLTSGQHLLIAALLWSFDSPR